MSEDKNTIETDYPRHTYDQVSLNENFKNLRFLFQLIAFFSLPLHDLFIFIFVQPVGLDQYNQLVAQNIFKKAFPKTLEQT